MYLSSYAGDTVTIRDMPIRWAITLERLSGFLNTGFVSLTFYNILTKKKITTKFSNSGVPVADFFTHVYIRVTCCTISSLATAVYFTGKYIHKYKL